MRRAARRLVLAGLAAAALSATAAASADAYLYWGGMGTNGNVGRAALNGDGPEPNFIPAADGACGVAVDFEYVYWVDISDGDVGRAELDGSNPNPDFIDNVSAFCGIAVNPTHIFWTTSGDDIARADRDGTNTTTIVNNTSDNACGLALNSTHIFWGKSSTPLSIGRADIGGTNANNDFIPGAGPTNGCGVAVNSTHIFWPNAGGTAVGRANLDGTSPDANWLDTGTLAPVNTAVDATHLYWAIQSGGTIHRSNLDGSSPTQLVDTDKSLNGLALDTGAPPAPVCPDENESTAFETPLPIDLDCTGTYTITYEIVDPPTDGDLTGFNPATGAVTYTPDPGFDGQDSFTYRASNPGGPSNTATVTIDVGEQVPTCTDVQDTTPFQTPVQVTLDCTGTGTLSYELGAAPAHGQLSGLNASAGTVTYTPDAGFSGPDTFTFRASNSGGPAAFATATVEVGQAPPCPAVELRLERWNPVPPFGKLPKVPGLRAKLTASVPASVQFQATVLFDGDGKLSFRSRTMDVQSELVLRALLRGRALRELSPGDPARLRVAAEAKPLTPSFCPRQDRVELTIDTRVKRVSKRNAMARRFSAF